MKNRILIASLLAGVSLCGLGALAQSPDAGSQNPAPRQGPDRPRMSFSALDLNGDGSVTEDEFNKARSEMRARMGPGSGPGARGPGRAGGDLEKPREARQDDRPAVTPSPDDSREAAVPSVERQDPAPRRERARDGEGPQIRERRRDGDLGRPGEERPGMRRQARLSEPSERPRRESGEFRRGPRWDGERGERPGAGGYYRFERREMAVGGGPGRARMGMDDGVRRPAADGMGPHGRGMRRGAADSAWVCPHCGCPAGPREPGEGRGFRRMAPRG